MRATPSIAQLREAYEEAAREYQRTLRLENYMEAEAQGTQRKITLESLDLLKPKRPDIHHYNEMLLQGALPAEGRPPQVVPDNMVVVHDGPLEVGGSYNVVLQPVGPYLVLEYVSPGQERKDYVVSFGKYEQIFRVPYYLMFYPESQELTLYRHNGTKYVTVLPNERNRYPIDGLELEVAILDGWVRYWFREQLLLLPAQLEHELIESRQYAAEQMRRADEQTRRADEQTRRADEQTRRADEQAQLVRKQKRQTRELKRRADAEQQARLQMEQELAQLRAQLEQLRGTSGT